MQSTSLPSYQGPRGLVNTTANHADLLHSFSQHHDHLQTCQLPLQPIREPPCVFVDSNGNTDSRKKKAGHRGSVSKLSEGTGIDEQTQPIRNLRLPSPGTLALHRLQPSVNQQ